MLLVIVKNLLIPHDHCWWCIADMLRLIAVAVVLQRCFAGLVRDCQISGKHGMKSIHMDGTNISLGT